MATMLYGCILLTPPLVPPLITPSRETTVTSQQLAGRSHFPRIYLRDPKVPQIYGSLDLRRAVGAAGDKRRRTREFSPEQVELTESSNVVVIACTYCTFPKVESPPPPTIENVELKISGSQKLPSLCTGATAGPDWDN
ncbi:unnamed protein product [Pleuronectes platessa]|uniref:Uncharacterized protein n=1 Tax=Pleuronectes platessa TaxID=8262 RepID=A0A9N7TUY0_PLEPL|nr:unnamed protein product [Pleuronectes platessa]